MGRPHALMHLPALVGRDLPVAIGIGHVEVLERGGLRFLKGHSAILVSVGHLEHVTAETAHRMPACLKRRPSGRPSPL